MAAEAACPAQAAPHRHRRANQDYSACNLFLPAEMWLKLGSDRSERNKAEELAEFLFSHLGLRLPTEPTYATMTALVCSSTSPSRFELHSALQVVKSSWRSLSTRMVKISKEDKKGRAFAFFTCPLGGLTGTSTFPVGGRASSRMHRGTRFRERNPPSGGESSVA